MAHCAGHGVIAGYTSGSCAPCSPGGCVAQLNQIVEGKLQAVARRAEQLARRASTGNCADSTFN
ncbi:hypothetical protein A2U01_0060231 [Trifolium medium]|uniref:Uncharacterized protein n=1 Tax=Trifolium medium TaxID=97028 RepID=A0A392RS18_9FABA|nr:hypothetical protein [Trifolium medium]